MGLFDQNRIGLSDRTIDHAASHRLGGPKDLTTMARDLQNRVIVITGASSGIGAATAIACAQAGMDVVVAARRRERLERVANQIQQCGRRALPVVCDVNQDQDVDQVFAQTLQEFGRLDCLFANAGSGLIAPVMNTTSQMIRDLFETNFYGTLRCVWAAVAIMRRQSTHEGHVLICSSCVSELSPPKYGVYSATKAAQDSITQSLRAELASENIYVSSVHPITTQTEFFDTAGKRSPGNKNEHKPHKVVVQSAEHVASKIIGCLRKPHPEIWPHVPTKYAMAICTAFPRLTAWAMRRMAKNA